MSTLIDIIAQHAEQRADATAIQGTDTRVSYAQLDRRIAELADQLQRRGYQCVGLLADNGIAWTLIDLACMRAGICCVPVPVFFSAAQREHLLRTAKIQCLIGDPEWLAQAAALESVPLFDQVHGIGFLELQPVVEGVSHPLADVAKVTFTSGSTGQPKGVCLSQQQIDSTLQALNHVIEPGTSRRHLSVLPLVTLLENLAGLYLSLLQGAEIILKPMCEIGFSGLASLDAKTFFSVIEREQPQSLILVPELLRVLMQGVHAKAITDHQLKLIAVGGGHVAEGLLQQAATLGLPVLQGYGLSECASVVTLNGIVSNRPGSVGQALDHVQIKIADDGEILVAGNLMQGYLGEDMLTGDWLATGDLGYLDDDGYLYVTGRKKNLLITAYGKNISPEWVESMFLQSACIHQLMVTGEASAQLQAVIVPAPGCQPQQVDDAVRQINQSLPEYAQLAEYRLAVTPFQFDNGLLTANGRLRREAIRAHFA